MSHVKTTRTSALPFSPIPGHIVPMKFNLADTWTYDDTPLRKAWEHAYRNAAFTLTFGDEEKARTQAQLGIDLEQAYIDRLRAEAVAR